MLKLLLIDDDEEEYELLSAALKELQAGATVIYSSDCKEIVETISKHAPDLVFLDINMSTVDGIECLKSIRATTRFKDLPVIMYSTSNNKSSVMQSFENRANLYVVKSYSYQGLLLVLEKVLDINWKKEKPKTLNEFVYS